MCHQEDQQAIPGSLALVLLAIILVWSLRLDLDGVKIVGMVPEGLPDPSIPNLNFQTISQLLSLALIISLVGFMESITIGKAIQARHRTYEVQANKELIALGLSNMIGSVFHAIPCFRRTRTHCSK